MSRDDALRRAEAALFEGRGTEPSPLRGEANEPARRILQNLAEVDPLTVLLADEAPAPRRGRKPGSKNKPKQPHNGDAVDLADSTSARRVELTPAVVNAALASMAKAAPAVAAERPAEAPTGMAPAAASNLAGGGRRHFVPPAHSSPPPAADEAAVTAPQSRGTMLRTRSKIMDVYVFKTEPKAWEIWKRRSRTPLR